MRTVFKSAPPRSFFLHIKVSRRRSGGGQRAHNNFPSCFSYVCVYEYACNIRNYTQQELPRVYNIKWPNVSQQTSSSNGGALSAIGIALTIVAIKSIKKIYTARQHGENMRRRCATLPKKRGSIFGDSPDDRKYL